MHRSCEWMNFLSQVRRRRLSRCNRHRGAVQLETQYTYGRPSISLTSQLYMDWLNTFIRLSLTVRFSRDILIWMQILNVRREQMRAGTANLLNERESWRVSKIVCNIEKKVLNRSKTNLYSLSALVVISSYVWTKNRVVSLDNCDNLWRAQKNSIESVHWPVQARPSVPASLSLSRQVVKSILQLTNKS